MNKNLMAVFTLLFTVGCATTSGLVSQQDISTWDAMSACAREAEGNALRAKCDQRFKDTTLSGRLDSVKPLGVGDIFVLEMTLTESTLGAGSRAISCMMRGSQNREQAAKLNPGERVTVRGTPTRIYRSGYYDAITFEPCDFAVAPSTTTPQSQAL